MVEMFPSEIARLVLDYIESNGCKQTASLLLEELPDLWEIKQRRRKGFQHNLRVGENTLLDVINEYAAIKFIIIDSMDKYPATFGSLNRRDILSHQVQDIVDLAIQQCKSRKYFPRNNRNSRNPCNCKGLRNDHGTISVSIPNFGSQEIPLSVSEEEPNKDERSASPSHWVESRVPVINEGEVNDANSSDPQDPITPPSKTSNSPQRRKGSMRKKQHVSPKSSQAQSGDKMEKFLKNIINNKALHQKIAENINKTLFKSPEKDHLLQEGLVVEPETALQTPSELGINFTSTFVNSQPAPSQESSLNISANALSSLCYQVTSDPMMESILASLDNPYKQAPSDNRPLITPEPVVSAVHSEGLLTSSAMVLCNSEALHPNNDQNQPYFPCERSPNRLPMFPASQVESSLVIQNQVCNIEKPLESQPPDAHINERSESFGTFASPVVDDGQSVPSNYINSMTPQHTMVTRCSSGFSPMNPPSVRAVPVTCSNDAFTNSIYFSGTPDHPNSYTLTELGPPSVKVDNMGVIHQMTSTPCVPLSENPESVGIGTHSIPEVNNDGSHIVVEMATEPCNPENQIEESLLNSSPSIPGPSNLTFEQMRNDRRKQIFNMRGRKQPIRIKGGPKRKYTKRSTQPKAYEKKRKESKLPKKKSLKKKKENKPNSEICEKQNENLENIDTANIGETLSNNKDVKSNEISQNRENSSQYESLISFSKSFVLDSDLKRKCKSPAVDSNGKVRIHRGSHSTPRNKSYVRALDFNTPKKFASTTKTSPRARANLKFGSPSPLKRLQLMKSLKKKKKLFTLEPVTESPVESSNKDVNGTDSPEVNNAVQYSDISPLHSDASCTSSLLQLETPAKNVLSALSLEASTPFIFGNSSSRSPANLDLNTPVLSAQILPTVTPGSKSSGVKSYPQGPYSTSSDGSSYYHPSERSVVESEGKSPQQPQDELEQELIRTAQENEKYFLNLTDDNPEPENNETGINEPEASEEVSQSSNTEQTKENLYSHSSKTEQAKENSNAQSSKKRFCYKKFSNKKLGELVEKEMEVYQQMRSEHETKRQSEIFNVSCSDSEEEEEEEQVTIHDDQPKDLRPSLRDSELTFSSFHNDLNLLLQFVFDVLAKSHIDSASGVLQSLKNILRKPEARTNFNDDPSRIDFLIQLVVFYSSPTMLKSIVETLPLIPIVDSCDQNSSSSTQETESCTSIQESEVASLIAQINKAIDDRSGMRKEEQQISANKSLISFNASVSQDCGELAVQETEGAGVVDGQEAVISTEVDSQESDIAIELDPQVTDIIDGVDAQETDKAVGVAQDMDITANLDTKETNIAGEVDTPNANINTETDETTSNKVKNSRETSTLRKFRIELGKPTLNIVECEIEAIVSDSTGSTTEKQQSPKLQKKLSQKSKTPKEKLKSNAVKKRKYSPDEDLSDDESAIEKRSDSRLKESSKTNLDQEIVSTTKSPHKSKKSKSEKHSTKSKYSKSKRPDSESSPKSKSRTKKVTPKKSSTRHKSKEKTSQSNSSSRKKSKENRTPEEDKKTDSEMISPDKFCARMVCYKANTKKDRQRDTKVDMGSVINITPKDRSKKVTGRGSLSRLRRSRLNSSQSSSSVDIMGDRTPVLESPYSTPQGERDKYMNLEQQLAELDGVGGTPTNRKQILNQSAHDENLSCILTPTQPESDENALNADDNLIVHSKKSKSMLSFVPLPGTPEKQVEQICQAIVKDKLGIVAFPSPNKRLFGDDNTNTFKISPRLFSEKSNKDHLNESTSSENTGNESETSVEEENERVEGVPEEVTYCLSYSECFNLLSLNLDDQSSLPNKRKRTSKSPIKTSPKSKKHKTDPPPDKFKTSLECEDNPKTNLRSEDKSKTNLRGVDKPKSSLRGEDKSKTNLRNEDKSKTSLRREDQPETSTRSEDKSKTKSRSETNQRCKDNPKTNLIIEDGPKTSLKYKDKPKTILRSEDKPKTSLRSEEKSKTNTRKSEIIQRCENKSKKSHSQHHRETEATTNEEVQHSRRKSSSTSRLRKEKSVPLSTSYVGQVNEESLLSIPPTPGKFIDLPAPSSAKDSKNSVGESSHQKKSKNKDSSHRKKVKSPSKAQVAFTDEEMMSLNSILNQFPLSKYGSVKLERIDEAQHPKE